MAFGYTEIVRSRLLPYTQYGFRYVAAFAYRFNRRFHLETITQRLIMAAATTGARPERWLREAEASC